MAAVGAAMLAAFGDLADQLEAAGVGMSIEPGEVPVPGAWLSPRTVDTTRGTLTSPGTATAHLYLIAADTGDEHAFTVLAGLLDKVLPLVTESEFDEINIGTSISLPDSPGLPAFRLSIDLVL